MPESVFVDTGHILALVNENDQHHAETVALSQTFDGQPIVVTDAVLLEIGNALSRMDRDAAVQIIEDLREPPGVTVVNLTPGLFESAFELYRRHRQAMGPGRLRLLRRHAPHGLEDRARLRPTLRSGGIRHIPVLTVQFHAQAERARSTAQ
jgi:hypothetical protein